MDKDTLYWIFSTLPQVIGALTGLLIAGITFFFQSLDKGMEKDESSVPAIQEIKKQTYNKTLRLLIVSILAILVDIGLLGITPWFSDILTIIHYINWYGQIAIIIIVLVAIFLNLDSFWALYHLLKRILSPKYQQEINNSLAQREKENIPIQDSVTPQEFLDYFIKFERLIRKFFPNVMQRNPLRSLINQLVGENIIERDNMPKIQSIINKRNIFAHGGDIGRVDKNTISFLNMLIVNLENKLGPYQADRRISRMEEAFQIWINRYVEDLMEAEQLEYAVKHEKDCGIYRVFRDNARLYVHNNDGKPLYLGSDKSKQIFLKILETSYDIAGDTFNNSTIE